MRKGRVLCNDWEVHQTLPQLQILVPVSVEHAFPYLQRNHKERVYRPAIPVTTDFLHLLGKCHLPRHAPVMKVCKKRCKTSIILHTTTATKGICHNNKKRVFRHSPQGEKGFSTHGGQRSSWILVHFSPALLRVRHPAREMFPILPT